MTPFTGKSAFCTRCGTKIARFNSRVDHARVCGDCMTTEVSAIRREAEERAQRRFERQHATKREVTV